MEPIADRTTLIDLLHGGRTSVIACAVLELADGVALVDPGPTATIPVLRSSLEAAGMTLGDVRALLATHIHLDHAGACGSLVRENPAIQVYVHERGAPHLIDPSRLVASATRLFGDRMEQLWGECVPVPKENLRILTGEERIEPATGSRPIEVAYTPGHASHHVSYYDTQSGIAFIGDAGGGRIRDGKVVLPATPPPDIDIDTIRTSFQRILRWDPNRLFVTHFGPATGLEEHGAQLETTLGAWADRVRASLADAGDDSTRARSFGTWVAAELRETLGEDEAVSYEHGAPPILSWYGLARYWRKRG